jgi:hypothetical protein
MREMNTGLIDIDKIPDEGGKKMKRNKNKNFKMIELGDKTIMIDAKTVEKENNRAEKQCQDNNMAFYYYKNKNLFPGHTGPSATDKELEKNKAVVDAFK